MEGRIEKGRGGPHAIKVMAWVNALASALWHRTHIFADIGVSAYFSGAPISAFFNTIGQEPEVCSRPFNEVEQVRFPA
jgi:hypothetical protein